MRNTTLPDISQILTGGINANARLITVLRDNPSQMQVFEKFRRLIKASLVTEPSFTGECALVQNIIGTTSEEMKIR
jgi:hypothetical protein